MAHDPSVIEVGRMISSGPRTGWAAPFGTLSNVVEDLGKRQVGFMSLCDGHFDTTSASGKLIFHIFTALAESERSLIQERTNAGLKAARARGRLGGRRPIPANDPRVQTARRNGGRQPSLANVYR